MTANIGFIMNAAQTLANKLTIHRPSNTLTEGSFPTPGGPTKHRIGLFPCGHQFAHSEKFNDPFFNFFEP